MKRVLGWVAGVLAAALVLLLAYGTLIEPRLILGTQREQVALPRLTDDWAGTEVALLADLQVGMWFDNTGMMRRAVDRLVEDEPDVVLLGGDFVYGEGDTAEKIEEVLDILAPILDSEIPTYAVLGNHDYEAGAAEELTELLEDAGVPVLRNDAVTVPAPDGADPAEPLYVVGIGPVRPGLADVDAALAEVPDDAPRVVLMHNPLTFAELPAQAAPLAVAGHTHCGQIALPFTEHWSWLDVTAAEKIVADDWAEEGYGAAGNRLFVTCGIGMSAVPVRINAPPHVAFFELQPAA